MAPQSAELTAWLRPAEVGEMLGVSGSTISEWARNGKIPSFTTPGGQRRFRRVDIEQILAAGYNPTEAAS